MNINKTMNTSYSSSSDVKDENLISTISKQFIRDAAILSGIALVVFGGPNFNKVYNYPFVSGVMSCLKIAKDGYLDIINGKTWRYFAYASLGLGLTGLTLRKYQQIYKQTDQISWFNYNLRDLAAGLFCILPFVSEQTREIAILTAVNLAVFSCLNHFEQAAVMSGMISAGIGLTGLIDPTGEKTLFLGICGITTLALYKFEEMKLNSPNYHLNPPINPINPSRVQNLKNSQAIFRFLFYPMP